VDYQLGNGKRSSLAVPQHLPPLVPKVIDALNAAPRSEAGISSGTVRPAQIPADDHSIPDADDEASAVTHAAFPSSTSSKESQCIRSKWQAHQAECEMRGDGRSVLERFGIVQ